jgi:phosphotransferase system enzyme I (PtsI)
MDTGLILGIAMDKGGYTGHVAILARSLGIPCVVGLEKASSETQAGMLCALDGTMGSLIINPDESTLAVLEKKETERRQELSVLSKTAREPAQTRDGFPILVCANIGSVKEAQAAVSQGADGVGLFRTEFLYMDSFKIPSEDEQFEIYKHVLKALEGKPLTIRTLDIGGDKEHPALALEKENNPFLGYRAIRLSLDQPSVFKPQLRAILRAAAFGGVEVMFPLIISLNELRQARKMVEECRAELIAEKIETGNPALGIMVETPAAALLAMEFADEADFFSIGTNDLTQYTLAVDRGNTRIAGLYDSLNPAVLRLLVLICDAAKAAGIPVCLCGELASDPKALPLLIGLGISSLSVSASFIPRIKKEICAINKEHCISLALQAPVYSSTEELQEFLAKQH